MKAIILGRTVNLQGKLPSMSTIDELAYALATSMTPAIVAFQQEQKRVAQTKANLLNTLRHLQQQQQQLQAQLSQEQRTGEVLRSKQQQAERSLKAVEAQRWKMFVWLYMLLFGNKWQAQYDEIARQLRDIQTAIRENYQEVNRLDVEIQNRAKEVQQNQQYLQEYVEAEQQLVRLPQCVEGVGSVFYPIAPVVIQREVRDRRTGIIKRPRVCVFIDPNGDPVSFELQEITIPRESLEVALGLIHSLKDDNILLDAGDMADDIAEWGRLFGVEGKIIQIVDIFNNLINSSVPKSFQLPIIPRAGALGELLAANLSSLQTQPVVDIQLDQESEREYLRYDEIAERVRAVLATQEDKGHDSDRFVEDARRTFEENFDRLERNREKVSNINQRMFYKIHADSHLVRYHYFCPRCNVIPQYILDEFGIDLKHIENVQIQPVRQLIANLSRYQDACLKSVRGCDMSDASKQKIEESWLEAYDFLTGTAQLILSLIEEIAHYKRVEDTPEIRRTIKAKQSDLHLKQRLYRKTVLDMLKTPLKQWISPISESGSDDESVNVNKKFLTLNPNTRLVLSIEQNSWHCPLCESQFSHEKAWLGAVDRIRHDVLIPLTETLWNEEGVWSKVVDLLGDLSKEIRDRRVEEATAIQAPIDQFLADSRQIRERLQQAYNKGRAAEERLNRIFDNFRRLGLLSEQALQQLNQESNETTGRLHQVDQDIDAMNVKENSLQVKPRELVFTRSLPISPDRDQIEKISETGLFPISNFTRTLSS